MILLLLAYLGGVLTILSPCILPVLPFVFARAGRSFTRSALPLLTGMALSFAAVATLAAVGGGWAVQANQVGRWIALLLLAFFGVTLLFPAIADRAMQPFVAWGARLSAKADAGTSTESIGSSLLLGVATGLLWAPCAGPILGIILTGAALQGASVGTTLLLLAYGLGAATSLGLALLVGGRVFAAMKRSLGIGNWVRRGLGVAVLAGVLIVALGLDTAYLAKLSTAQTNAIESGLARTLGLKDVAESTVLTEANGKLDLPVEGVLPPLEGITQWMNSPPLTREQLRGKVVLIDFWTYSCINCLRSVPYVKAWDERYRKAGLVIIGVHAPEFAFEKDPANVRKAVRDLGIRYPVALDNDFAVWRAFKNRYWPAHYFVDAEGRVRYHHFGEGKYDTSERVIRQLLQEAGRDLTPIVSVQVKSGAAQAPAQLQTLRSPETYLGYWRADRLVSPGGLVRDRSKAYAEAPLTLNQWTFGGQWKVERQHALAELAGARVTYRFHARDLHLVLKSASGKPIRFRVTLDGQPPGADAGVDIDAAGNGRVTDERLYQLIRQKGPVRERTFRIEFLDPGAEVYAFTFG